MSGRRLGEQADFALEVLIGPNPARKPPSHASPSVTARIRKSPIPERIYFSTNMAAEFFCSKNNIDAVTLSGQDPLVVHTKI